MTARVKLKRTQVTKGLGHSGRTKMLGCKMFTLFTLAAAGICDRKHKEHQVFLLYRF